MITDRFIEPDDLSLLELSLAKDEYHTKTSTDFFYQPGTLTKVYVDEQGPVLFARVSAALRLDLQFMDNYDAKRNIRVMMEGFPLLVAKAKENGYSEIIFNTSNDLLRRFCIKRFGFVDSSGELRKFL